MEQKFAVVEIADGAVLSVSIGSLDHAYSYAMQCAIENLPPPKASRWELEKERSLSSEDGSYKIQVIAAHDLKTIA